MKNIKNLAYIAAIALAVLVFGYLVWLSASYFLSLNAQVSQNTQNIQQIIQFINQKTQPATGASAAPSAK
jgi:predicted PurR-regulated permease PerM